ncbi:phage tail sheath family protein [Tepidanaerobacter syntrophicus]|uniref:phage tail sheath family protein n=1 Tax=Tepidanaerobacter syntrophicus TaxID=224999 RepID=UPI001BD6BD26|nr:phage tail sheath family protein [Tepidanaerobacter syntrophicus]
MAPIGGGTFTVQNKILPGAYINFVSAGRAAQLGSRGVVALPLELNWGPENKVFAVTAEDFNRTAIDIFGYDPTDASLLLVREALKRAKTLLAYRVNSGGQKASATVGGMAVTAKWGGTRGNDLKVAILTNADDATKVDVVTYLGTMEVDRQTVPADSGSANLKDNNFVTFGEAQTLTPTSATALTGGSNGTVDGTAYSNFLNAIEVEAFNVIGYPGTDETIKALIAAFVKRLRYDNGVKIVGVLYQYDGDDIGLINVKNGVILADGTTITGDKAVAWVAGASAGAEVNESLTNVAYDGAVDVDIKYTKSQYEAAIQNGEFAFYADNGKARVLTDINSLVTFGDGVSEDWTSNRVVRVMDGWANDVARIFGERYIGTVTNSDTGRELFKADLVSLAMQYQAIDAISNFESADIVIQQGNGKRDVVVNCALQPNDSMEKLYMTVTVN